MCGISVCWALFKGYQSLDFHQTFFSLPHMREMVIDCLKLPLCIFKIKWWLSKPWYCAVMDYFVNFSRENECRDLQCTMKYFTSVLQLPETVIEYLEQKYTVWTGGSTYLLFNSVGWLCLLFTGKRLHWSYDTCCICITRSSHARLLQQNG